MKTKVFNIWITQVQELINTITDPRPELRSAVETWIDGTGGFVYIHPQMEYLLQHQEQFLSVKEEEKFSKLQELIGVGLKAWFQALTKQFSELGDKASWCHFDRFLENCFPTALEIEITDQYANIIGGLKNISNGMEDLSHPNLNTASLQHNGDTFFKQEPIKMAKKRGGLFSCCLGFKT